MKRIREIKQNYYKIKVIEKMKERATAKAALFFLIDGMLKSEQLARTTCPNASKIISN